MEKKIKKRNIFDYPKLTWFIKTTEITESQKKISYFYQQNSKKIDFVDQFYESVGEDFKNSRGHGTKTRTFMCNPEKVNRQIDIVIEKAKQKI